MTLKLDIQSRYIWRGQSWGGNYFVIQPTVEYKANKKMTLGVWATTNFKKDYFYNDGSFYKGYQEFDMYLIYNVNKYMSVQLWDYYWPSVKKVEGIDNGFFNYGKNSVKTIDFNLLFDFSEVWLPFTTTISTLIAGNDYRYDVLGKNPKQNFTTYAEVGYTFEDVLKKTNNKVMRNITVSPTAGMVFNNQAKYYVSGDYNKPSLVNLSLEMVKEFELAKQLNLPISLVFTHNATIQNTQMFGRNFLIFGANLTY
ncbi:hypothetical protein [Flavobacterium amnicola]|uniref:hypothetical protein n=1 Tax=Flavobacterium amnicola TaxID=2506422 RepID=UPI0013E93F30|nr:hypothetical protein [Flavobacterium amnicola]